MRLGRCACMQAARERAMSLGSPQRGAIPCYQRASQAAGAHALRGSGSQANGFAIWVALFPCHLASFAQRLCQMLLRTRTWSRIGSPSRTYQTRLCISHRVTSLTLHRRHPEPRARTTLARPLCLPTLGKRACILRAAGTTPVACSRVPSRRDPRQKNKLTSAVSPIGEHRVSTHRLLRRGTPMNA